MPAVGRLITLNKAAGFVMRTESVEPMVETVLRGYKRERYDAKGAIWWTINVRVIIVTASVMTVNQRASSSDWAEGKVAAWTGSINIMCGGLLWVECYDDRSVITRTRLLWWGWRWRWELYIHAGYIKCQACYVFNIHWIWHALP